MPFSKLFQLRMEVQGLTQPSFSHAADVISWLGAVQSQEYHGAKWAIGLRMQAASDNLIDQAFNDGAILRTHVMRPTWHFVTPADIRWMLELTAERVNAASAYMIRQVNLDEKIFARSQVIIEGVLRGGRYRTKAELGAELAKAGIMAEGVRLSYILMRAELDALICSGPRRGKQFTYAMLEERAPQARRLERDEALAELTLRYFTGHGPAAIRDFSWWSGLTMKDANAGLDLCKDRLVREEIDDQEVWFSTEMKAGDHRSESAFLLPTYDELLVGYADFNKTRLAGWEPLQGNTYDPTLVIDGQVAGSWKRSLKKDLVSMQVMPFEPLDSRDIEVVREAAGRYGYFMQLPIELAISPARSRTNPRKSPTQPGLK